MDTDEMKTGGGRKTLWRRILVAATGVLVLAVAVILVVWWNRGQDHPVPEAPAAAGQELAGDEAQAPKDFDISLKGYYRDAAGERVPVTVTGEIHGEKVEEGTVTIGDREYMMIGSIMGDTYRLVCRSSREFYVLNLMPMNGHFEGTISDGVTPYDLVLE